MGFSPCSDLDHILFIRGACDFSIFSCFLHIQPAVFQARRPTRHPERSASQIYRKQRAVWRGVEGPRRCLLADALGSFPAANCKGQCWCFHEDSLMIGGGCGPVGTRHTNGAPQIRSLARDDKKERVVVRKGRLLNRGIFLTELSQDVSPGYGKQDDESREGRLKYPRTIVRGKSRGKK
jgi:hypothetical protein